MKKTLLLAVVALFLGTQTSFAVVNLANVPVSTFSSNADVKALPADVASMNLEKFMSLTPAKYKEMTGEKLGWKKSLQLKAAQKAVKKHMAGGNSDIPKGVYILGAILGFSWILMGVMDDFQGKNWWVNLLLWCLCGLPGLIHAFIKMKDYYK